MPAVNNNKTKTISGDLLWTQDFYGTDGSNMILAGQIRAYADADATPNAVPSRFEWWTSTTGGTLTKALTIDKSQIATFVGAITTSGGLTSSSQSGIGYATGAGTSVAQQTNKGTAVTWVAAPVGNVTLNAASLQSNTSVAFTLISTAISANDIVLVNHASAGTGGSYQVWATNISSGQCVINVRNITGAPLAEAIVLNIMVLKGVVA